MNVQYEMSLEDVFCVWFVVFKCEYCDLDEVIVVLLE